MGQSYSQLSIEERSHRLLNEGSSLHQVARAEGAISVDYLT